MIPAAGTSAAAPAIARLSALAPLDDADLDLIVKAAANAQWLGRRNELVRHGEALTRPSLILSGWAARIRDLSDGRRQLLYLMLPGDLIGASACDDAVAATSVVAISEVTLCRLPRRSELACGAGLLKAYNASCALDESYLLAQITRLGRLNAHERIADLLLELHDRLALAGLAGGGRLPLPLTQEMIADMLGLTSVHVNRMLQQLRREGSITLAGGMVMIHDPAGLADLVEYRRATVC